MPRPNRGVPNPFYVLLLLVSVAFVVTVLGWLIAPTVLAQAPEAVARGERPGTLAVAAWLERHSPSLLTYEILVLTAAAVLAVATDHLFAPPPDGPKRS